MTRRPSEGRREELESAFTPILRKVWNAVPSVLAAVFVDNEGECIDYVSSIDPFEAKVCGAHASMLVTQLRAAQGKLGLLEPLALSVSASERELWARRISDDHTLVVVSGHGAEAADMWSALEGAVRAFRDEVGLPAPAWELSPAVDVEVRSAVGWPFAPVAFTLHGDRVSITDVMGRWIEPPNAPGIGEQTCFRVRTDAGHELTLVHDAGRNGWVLRP